MMRKAVVIALVIFVFSLTNIAYAQLRKGSGPRFYADFKPVVGGWSEYQMTTKGEQPFKMKIAIVGHPFYTFSLSHDLVVSSGTLKRYCGTIAKAGGNGENKLLPAITEGSCLLEGSNRAASSFPVTSYDGQDIL